MFLVSAAGVIVGSLFVRSQPLSAPLLLLGFGYLPDQLQMLLIARPVLSLNPTTRESHSELI
jgi:hypothetical protein